MKSDILEQYAALTHSLKLERNQIKARLLKIEAALSGEIPASVTTEPVAKRGPGRPKKRKMSAAGRKAIGEAAKARWAKIHAKKAAKLTAKTSKPAKTTPAQKPKRKMSAAGKAAISAATKARWAKIRAEKAAKAAK
jgi:hypothetical protein